jgi:hypothetical protein
MNMYRPYVGGKTVSSKHLSTILDVEIEYPVPGASAMRWILAAATAGLAAALWLGPNPLPL